MLRQTRWWPAALILLVAISALSWQWLREEATRQNRVMGSMAVVAIAAILLLLWLLLLSRLPVRSRLVICGSVLLLAAAAAFLVEIRGVTGDLVPVVGWRWGSGPSFGEISGQEVRDGVNQGDDFPQFLGPKRNATVPSANLSRDWRALPPEELWRRPVGAGWSGFAVVGGRAVTQEQRGDQEAVVAYELLSGEPLWTYLYDAAFETAIGGSGPRATPTISRGRVFTMGSTGILHSLDLATGELLWSHDLVAEFGAQIPEWGKSASPLVITGQESTEQGSIEQRSTEQVIVTSTGRSVEGEMAGGKGGDKALMAFDAASGDLLWSAGDERPGYSSPLQATLAGIEQIVVFNEASVTGHTLADGSQLWRYPWSNSQPNVSQPLPLSADQLLVSSGYGIGAALLHLSADGSGGLEAEPLWQSPRLKLKFSQAVFHQGFLYGLDDGVLTCVDPSSGERRWKKGRYGHGQILLVGDLLLLQSEKGKLVLIDPNPDELTELASLEVLDGRAWNTMAVAGNYLLMRNDREAVCFELR
ncbi:MAG: PQQ-like beta-propeller repeat protein [Deltaproteobacteria bacterium]|nr:PQQ-like beta-propeller repeat protein [Deltaproteobacteria bacterium]